MSESAQQQETEPLRFMSFRLAESRWKAFRKWLVDHGLSFQEWAERKVDEELCPDTDWKERGER